MLNLLKDYICRSLPESGCLATNPNLEKKVDETGKFLPFRGNTAVFLLNEQEKAALEVLREGLYAAAPDMLAQRLGRDTFHVTLHDLANGDPDDPGLAAWMAQTEAHARAILRSWNDPTPLRMRGTWVFNMVNTSLVLGLEPVDPDCARRLGEMYRQLETVRSLGYALTPHITLAYFRPGVYGPEQVEKLRAALKAAPVYVELLPDRLALQNFTDMNHYTTMI